MGFKYKCLLYYTLNVLMKEFFDLVQNNHALSTGCAFYMGQYCDVKLDQNVLYIHTYIFVYMLGYMAYLFVSFSF